jgi:hypothetical protein
MIVGDVMLLDLSSLISKIDEFFNALEQIASEFFTRANLFILTIARISYITLATAGLLLYFSGIDRYRGRSLIIGGLILALITEFMGTT